MNRWLKYLSVSIITICLGAYTSYWYYNQKQVNFSTAFETKQLLPEAPAEALNVEEQEPVITPPTEATAPQPKPKKAVVAQPASEPKKITTSRPPKPTYSPLPCLQKDPLYWDWAHINTQQIYFPQDFLWGVGTSAHQHEGNTGNNDWKAWEESHNLPLTGDACQHWDRYKQDIQLIKKLGVKCYRFSVEWSKIEPKQGMVNHIALNHYEDVCKELILNGIKPVITLHHYTNPTWFAALGGFEKAHNISYFVNFAQVVFKQLQPYGHLWLTFNSPTSYVARAYHAQLAPPGVENMQLMQEVLKNMLDAHVQTYHALKKLRGGKEAQIGICHNIYQVEPKNFWDKVGCSTAYNLFSDNVYKFFKTGHFNVSVPFKASLKHYNADAPSSLDFIGLNYYSHGLMTNFNVDRHPGEIGTQNKIYTIYPEGFYRALQEITKELANPLHIPIYVTENGIATTNENQRKLFFERYLFALSYALNNGCPIKGYMVWSLMDNYEWGSYDIKYGIYEVDFKTQERSTQPRPGAQYFVDVVNTFS